MYLNLFQKTNSILTTQQTNKNQNNPHQTLLYNIKQPQKELNHNTKKLPTNKYHPTTLNTTQTYIQEKHKPTIKSISQ